jgi:hypothetical protein
VGGINLIDRVGGISLTDRCLFFGHSFFKPIAEASQDSINELYPDVDIPDNTIVFSGGESGTPGYYLERSEGEKIPSRKYQREVIDVIEDAIDKGNLDCLVITYHPNYPDYKSYETFIQKFVTNNSNFKKVFIALPWNGQNPGPGNPLLLPSAVIHKEYLTTYYKSIFTPMIIEPLNTHFTTLEVIGIPYGQVTSEIRLLFESGELTNEEKDNLLPHGTNYIAPNNLRGEKRREYLYIDAGGHAGNLIIETANLVWLSFIYGIEQANLKSDYIYDLNLIAHEVIKDNKKFLGDKCVCHPHDNDNCVCPLDKKKGRP